MSSTKSIIHAFLYVCVLRGYYVHTVFKGIENVASSSNLWVTNCLQRALYIRANKWGLLPSKHKFIRIVQPKLRYVTVAPLTKANNKNGNVSDNAHIKGDVCNFVDVNLFS